MGSDRLRPVKVRHERYLEQASTRRRAKRRHGALLAELRGIANPVKSAAFSPAAARIVTASDATARVWRFDAVSGDTSTLPLWVQVLTGTELKGGGVQPLFLDAWNQRKATLEGQRDKAPPEEWFDTSKSTKSH